MAGQLSFATAFFQFLTLPVTLAAAVALAVRGCLGCFFSFFLCLAEVIEIYDLGHAFAPFHKSVKQISTPSLCNRLGYLFGLVYLAIIGFCRSLL